MIHHQERSLQAYTRWRYPNPDQKLYKESDDAELHYFKNLCKQLAARTFVRSFQTKERLRELHNCLGELMTRVMTSHGFHGASESPEGRKLFVEMETWKKTDQALSSQPHAQVGELLNSLGDLVCVFRSVIKESLEGRERLRSVADSLCERNSELLQQRQRANAELQDTVDEAEEGKERTLHLEAKLEATQREVILLNRQLHKAQLTEKRLRKKVSDVEWTSRQRAAATAVKHCSKIGKERNARFYRDLEEPELISYATHSSGESSSRRRNYHTEITHKKKHRNNVASIKATHVPKRSSNRHISPSEHSRHSRLPKSATRNRTTSTKGREIGESYNELRRKSYFDLYSKRIETDPDFPTSEPHEHFNTSLSNSSYPSSLMAQNLNEAINMAIDHDTQNKSPHPPQSQPTSPSRIYSKVGNNYDSNSSTHGYPMSQQLITRRKAKVRAKSAGRRKKKNIY